MTDTLPPTPDSEAIDWPALAARLSGEGEWQGESLQPALDVQTLQAAWSAARPDYPAAYSADRAWTRLQLAMPSALNADSRERANSHEHKPVLRTRNVARRYSRAWFGLGAMMAMVVVAVLFTLGRGAPVDNRESGTYITHRAQRASIILPDGSKAILAPDTRLSYTTGVSGARSISLAGQAYFMVTADPDHPFVVQTTAGHTQVLGTTFSVRAYPDDSSMQVAVAEGKVAVQPAQTSQQALLTSGDVGHVTPNGTVEVTHDFHVANMFGWASGRVGFQQEPLSVIIAELERLYDVTINVMTPALESRRVTITVSGESLPEVLEMLSAAISAQYRRDGNVITIF